MLRVSEDKPMTNLGAESSWNFFLNGTLKTVCKLLYKILEHRSKSLLKVKHGCEYEQLLMSILKKGLFKYTMGSSSIKDLFLGQRWN